MNRNWWWLGVTLLQLGAGCGKTDSDAAGTDVAGGTDGTGGHTTTTRGSGGTTSASGAHDSGSGVGGTSVVAVDGGTAGIGGTSNSTGGSGGSGGSGGAPSECIDGVRTIARLPQRTVGVAPLDPRTLVAAAQWDRIDFFDASLPDGSVTSPTVTWTLEDFGYGEAEDFAAITAYGDALAVMVREVDFGAHVFFRHPFGEPALPDATGSMRYPHGLVVGSSRLAIDSSDGIFIAVLDDEQEWQWSGPFEWDDERDAKPLAFIGDALLVGVSEFIDFDGNGQPTGAGGAGSEDDAHARLELLSVDGETLWSIPAVGNPSFALEVDTGWLIAETNSFWGSYQAAIEWLDPDGRSLTTLSRVPVSSSGDGEDGAFGLALYDQTVYVANCENALLAGTWSGGAIELSPVAAYGEPTYALCSAQQIGISEDLLVVGGADTYLARLCEGDE